MSTEKGELVGMDDQTVIGAYNTGFEIEHKKPGTSLSDAHHGGKMVIALAAQRAILKEIKAHCVLADDGPFWVLPEEWFREVCAKLGVKPL